MTSDTGTVVSVSVAWAELEGAMQTGDLLVFAGSEALSRWIELLTGGPFVLTGGYLLYYFATNYGGFL